MLVTVLVALACLSFRNSGWLVGSRQWCFSTMTAYVLNRYGILAQECLGSERDTEPELIVQNVFLALLFIVWI